MTAGQRIQMRKPIKKDRFRKGNGQFVYQYASIGVRRAES